MNRHEISSCNTDEKISFSQAAKGARKYGTVGSNMMKSQFITSYVQHKVQPSDTLQGIALRYETSMELIKRANKMWSNDALHLRDVLFIPVAADHDGEVLSTSADFSGNSHSTDVSVSSSAGDESQTSSDEKSLNDILSDIDSKIEHAKLVAQNLQQNSRVAKLADYSMNCSPKKRSYNNPSYIQESLPDVHARYFASAGDGEAPTVVILSDFHSRLSSSLQRLEKTYDDIYQL